MSRGNGQRQALPDGWEWKKLVDVARVLRGVTYKKGQAHREGAKGMVALLRHTNVHDELVLDDLLHVPRELVKSDQLLQPGDVVLTSSGSREHVGRASQVWGDREFTF